MAASVRKSRDARRDLLKHFVYIAGHSIAAARRFGRAAEKAMDQLAHMPGLGGLWESDNPALAGLRVWPIPKFANYLIFYRAAPDGIEVLRVLYAAQDIENLLGG